MALLSPIKRSQQFQFRNKNWIRPFCCTCSISYTYSQTCTTNTKQHLCVRAHRHLQIYMRQNHQFITLSFSHISILTKKRFLGERMLQPCGAGTHETLIKASGKRRRTHFLRVCAHAAPMPVPVAVARPTSGKVRDYRALRFDCCDQKHDVSPTRT